MAPPTAPIGAIYRGAVPFIAIQHVVTAILMAWPALATWLPSLLYR